MENQYLMSNIANKISDKLDWQKYYVGECEKIEMIKDVLDEFTSLMERAIVIASEE